MTKLRVAALVIVIQSFKRRRRQSRLSCSLLRSSEERAADGITKERSPPSVFRPSNPHLKFHLNNRREDGAVQSTAAAAAAATFKALKESGRCCVRLRRGGRKRARVPPAAPKPKYLICLQSAKVWRKTMWYTPRSRRREAQRARTERHKS